MAGRGLSGLVLLLVALAGGPLVAEYLPPGPGSLLAPASVVVAAAAAVILHALFAWPVLAGSREPRDVLVDALLLLALGTPFVAVLGASVGLGPESILNALFVVSGAIAVTAIWLVGPGRSGRFDRAYAALWVGVTAVLPIVAYVLLDFVGSPFPLGFRVSPVLAVRRVLLEMPGADPVPFLLTALAFLAVATSVSLVRRGASAGVILLFCLFAGSSFAAEATPVLGDRYVPGRTVPLLISGVEGPVTLRLPGLARYPAKAGRVVDVTGIPGLRSVMIDDEAVPVDLRAAPAGKWLVALGPVPPAVRTAARDAGYVIGTAAPGAERLGYRVFLVADGVVDTTGLLPEGDRAFLSGAGVAVIDGPADLFGESPLRRPWEEEGRVLSADGLENMFPRSGKADPGRARTTFLLLLAFGVVALAVIRFARRRAGSRWPAVGLLVLLGAAATGTAAEILDPVPSVEIARVEARGPGKVVTVFRIRARRAATERVPDAVPSVVLGRGREVFVFGDVDLELAAGETRYLAKVDGNFEARPGPVDFFLGPDGLAKPGQAALPAGEFLKQHFTGPDGRTTSDGWLVRKLLRLDGSLRRRYGVRIPEPGVLEVRRVPD